MQSNILQNLADSNGGEITLAIELAGALIPIGKAAVQEIKQIATGGETVTYAVLLQMDGAELDKIAELSESELAAVNAELAKLGLPPVPALPDPTVPPAAAADPTKGGD